MYLALTLNADFIGKLDAILLKVSFVNVMVIVMILSVIVKLKPRFNVL